MKLVAIDNPVLRNETHEIEDFEFGNRILDTLKKTLIENNALGVSASQIGIPWRVAIACGDDWEVEMINPRIIWHSDTLEVAIEGCLSLPNLFYWVPRFKKVRVEYYTREGSLKKLKARDMLARSIQHEIDHLDGILIDKRGVLYANTSLATLTTGENKGKTDTSDTGMGPGSNYSHGPDLRGYNDRHTKKV